ncbi:hypothetical protein ACHQM5_025077 [Ranunculus cassubicifolius]
MADALISVVVEQLASYVQNEVRLVVDTRQEALKLTNTLKMLQDVLADADEKQVKNKSVRLWLGDLKQVVYDADDVLDEWRTRAAISQLQSDVDVHVAGGTRKKISRKILMVVSEVVRCMIWSMILLCISRKMNVLMWRQGTRYLIVKRFIIYM